MPARLVRCSYTSSVMTNTSCFSASSAISSSSSRVNTFAAGIGGVTENQRFRGAARTRPPARSGQSGIPAGQRNIDRLRARESYPRRSFRKTGEKTITFRRGRRPSASRPSSPRSAAAGDDDLPLSVDFSCPSAGTAFGQRLAEVLRAPSDRILVYVVARRLRQPVEQRPRRVEGRGSPCDRLTAP